MFLIDIAVPRNIEPAVNELDNVFLYDIDDLDKRGRNEYEGPRSKSPCRPRTSFAKKWSA